MFRIKQLAQPALACVITLFLAACASSGPTFSQMKGTLPPIAADNGRIFFYRVSPFLGTGTAVQPPIRIDDTVVGHSVPNGFFYVDHIPGTFKISTSTEVTEETTLKLDAGQTRYVRTDISMGLLVGRVSPTIVDESQALQEIGDLHFTSGEEKGK